MRAVEVSLAEGHLARVQQGEIDVGIGLYQESLAIDEQIGNVGGSAVTLHQMAGVQVRLGDIDGAVDLYQESLTIHERIGDLRGKAATLHQMAGRAVQQGDIDAALDLYQQSLAINEQIGNVRGKAAILHQMAGIRAQQGDIDGALDLYQQSLAINEQIGNVRGKGTTLANMGYLEFGRSRRGEAHRLYAEAAALLASAQAWPDLATVLDRLVELGGNEAIGPAAQLMLLALRGTIQTQPHVALDLANDLGLGHCARPGLAALALLGAQSADDSNLVDRASSHLAALAVERDCTLEDLIGLMKPDTLQDGLVELNDALETLRGPDWVVPPWVR